MFHFEAVKTKKLASFLKKNTKLHVMRSCIKEFVILIDFFLKVYNVRLIQSHRHGIVQINTAQQNMDLSLLHCVCGRNISFLIYFL